MQVDPKSASCQICVKGHSGPDGYQLCCSLTPVGGEHDRVLSWQIPWSDLHHRMYEKLLVATTGNTQDHIQIGCLDPRELAEDSRDHNARH